MTQSISELTQALLTAAKNAGADAADAIAVDGTQLSIDIADGKLEKAERTESTDIGLRVLVGKRQACVSSSDINPDTLVQMAERAVFMAQEAPEDPYVGLADPDQLAQNFDIASLDIEDVTDAPSPQTLRAVAEEAEAAALEVDGVTQVEGATAASQRTRIHLAGTNGFEGGYSRTGHATYAVAIAGTGTKMERDSASDYRIHRSDLDAPKDIGRLAGERAIAMHGARKPKTGTFNVLYDERVAGSLIHHLLSAVNGAAIARGSSWLKDAMGEMVLPEGLSVTEDPLRARATSSRPFDGEGLPCQPRQIVENGRLMGWTLDLATARKLGMESSANARRVTSAPPSPGLTNIALTQGTASRADLLRDMGTGLLVTSMIGSTINPNTGDYSRGASGFWVEGGEIQYPVNECTIAGNLRDMLMRVIPANDARLHLSHVVPSLMIEGMSLAGA